MAPIGSGASGEKAYVVTGPTAGIGRQTALDLPGTEPSCLLAVTPAG